MLPVCRNTVCTIILSYFSIMLDLGSLVLPVCFTRLITRGCQKQGRVTCSIGKKILKLIGELR